MTQSWPVWSPSRLQFNERGVLEKYFITCLSWPNLMHRLSIFGSVHCASTYCCCKRLWNLKSYHRSTILQLDQPTRRLSRPIIFRAFSSSFIIDTLCLLSNVGLNTLSFNSVRFNNMTLLIVSCTSVSHWSLTLRLPGIFSFSHFIAYLPCLPLFQFPIFDYQKVFNVHANFIWIDSLLTNSQCIVLAFLFHLYYSSFDSYSLFLILIHLFLVFSAIVV